MKTLLLGDVSPTEITSPYFREKDITTLFNDTLSLFEGNDINFVNLECSLTDSEKPIEKFGPPLKAPLETAEVLKSVGVNYCGLSNNHIFDFGIKGVKDTVDALINAGIAYTGFGENYEDSRKNLVVEANGERVCIIAVCEHEYSYALEDRMGSRPFDEFETIEDIRQAKEESDRVIVLYHGGKEYCQYPSPRLVRACRAMARSGADVIIGQHSHCISCYEKYNDCHILYGQGNFHFVKESAYPVWYHSLAVKYDTVSHDIEFIPVKAEEKGVSLTKGDEKTAVLQAFDFRNNELANGEWKMGWHAFCESMKEKYINCIANAGRPDSTYKENHNFAHYLDCESHTDVWRELFPTANHTNEK